MYRNRIVSADFFGLFHRNWMLPFGIQNYQLLFEEYNTAVEKLADYSNLKTWVT
jgi:hypothetical protein